MKFRLRKKLKGIFCRRFSCKKEALSESLASRCVHLVFAIQYSANEAGKKKKEKKNRHKGSNVWKGFLETVQTSYSPFLNETEQLILYLFFECYSFFHSKIAVQEFCAVLRVIVYPTDRIVAFRARLFCVNVYSL